MFTRSEFGAPAPRAVDLFDLWLEAGLLESSTCDIRGYNVHSCTAVYGRSKIPHRPGAGSKACQAHESLTDVIVSYRVEKRGTD